MASASCTMRSTSESDRPPLERRVMDCFLPVDLSTALTLTMPLASMSNVTSICGTPRGAGGMPTRSNWPSILLSAAISRSPWKTLMPTCVWLSAAVEKTCDFLVGMVVFREIRRVKTPPSVSIPRESGVTSSSRISLTSPLSTPAWMAAPIATASSGLTALLGSLPYTDRTISLTFGMRVMPPTSSTSSISPGFTPASLLAFSQGAFVLIRKSSTMLSSLDLVICRFKCFGPVWSAVMKGRLMSVCTLLESSILAVSAASRRRCRASLS
mmetsp:Transcript_1470/g.3970  ORF Transcript_1470/g.3970 Transcript_1470/m.3970 type:complete len:269 (-) Transcript_1470:936-1742(-)